MFIIAAALSGVAHRITALPIDRFVAWSMFLGTLLVSGGIVLLVGDLVRAEDRSIATRRRG